MTALLETPRSGDGNAVALGAVMIAWVGLLVASSMRGRQSGAAANKDFSSLLGILVQGLGVGAAWWGGFTIVVSTAAPALVAAIPSAALSFGSLGLFIWAVRTMGRNWALVAQTRRDHQLVETGPFALMRNPIYVAIFGLMLATALAIGHAYNLIVAIPVFVIGTLMRVGLEEKLLSAAFGQAYDDYRKRVKRFIPAVW
jgi:hypothetical protein